MLSMTGYGKGEVEENNLKIVVEVKSVNHIWVLNCQDCLLVLRILFVTILKVALQEVIWTYLLIIKT